MFKKLKFRKSKVPKFYPMPVGSMPKNNLNFMTIWFLKKLKILVEWAIEWREKNNEINRKIFIELGLPEDTNISKLGSYHYKEFRRLKYIFSSKNVEAKKLPEPKKFHLHEELLKSFTNKSQNSAIELFKSMQNKDD